MTRARPLIRKHAGWWRIFVGHSRYMLPDYYTNRLTAMDAARKIRPLQKKPE